MQIVRTTYLSLGSNLGSKLENLQKTVDLIAENIGTITKISSIYKTASWGFDSDDFFNCCLQVSTGLNPEDLLNAIHKIELSLGRNRAEEDGYQARIIDIDVLLFDNEIIFSKELIVPHEDMLNRKFVMVPLAEIAPNSVHPIAKQRLQICLDNCTDDTVIEKTYKQLTRPISI